MRHLILLVFLLFSQLSNSQDTVTVNTIQEAITAGKNGKFVSLGLFEDPKSVFPSEFYQIPKDKLVGLVIDNCSYTSLPKNLSDYQHLVYFRYSWFYFPDCPLTQFPEFIPELTSLKHVHIEGAKLQTIPSLAKLVNLETLSIYYCGLPTFPTAVLENTSLVELNLACNKFSSIPNDIDRLSNLKRLNFEGGACGGTPISSVPSSIGNLKGLEIFSLGYTEVPIETLPESFYTLENLTYFNCDGCGLTKLSEGLGNFKKLEHLSLSNIEHFQAFPQVLFSLPSLKSFFFYESTESADPGLLKQENRINEWGNSLEDFHFQINISGRD